jgi:hypothetical protein
MPSSPFMGPREKPDAVDDALPRFPGDVDGMVAEA